MVTSHKLIVLVLVFAVDSNAPLFGWDNVGHMAVAYVAYQHLNAATKARVDTLLQLNPDYPKWKSTIPKGTSAAKPKQMVFRMAPTCPAPLWGKPRRPPDGTSRTHPHPT